MTPANDDADDPRALAVGKFRAFLAAVAEMQAAGVGWAQTALDLAEVSQECLERLFAEHPELRPEPKHEERD